MSEIGLAIAEVVSHWLLTTAAQVHTQVRPVVFALDKVAMGQVFLTVLQFSLVSISLCCVVFMYHLGDGQWTH
jgi:hypothetical protein